MREKENCLDIIYYDQINGIHNQITIEEEELKDVLAYLKNKGEILTRIDTTATNTKGIWITPNIKSAINYALLMHHGQTRKDGRPYIVHPIEVAKNVMKYKKSKELEALVISGILHDVVEDTSATFYDIYNKFGALVANIVQELTTDEEMKKALGKEEYLKIKMKSMTSWGKTLKLCDRLANVRDLSCCNEEFKNKIIKETIGILDEILLNATLSKTQINIIKDIILSLVVLCANDVWKIAKLSELLNMTIERENKFYINYELSDFICDISENVDNDYARKRLLQ